MHIVLHLSFACERKFLPDVSDNQSEKCFPKHAITKITRGTQYQVGSRCCTERGVGGGRGEMGGRGSGGHSVKSFRKIKNQRHLKCYN